MTWWGSRERRGAPSQTTVETILESKGWDSQCILGVFNGESAGRDQKEKPPLTHREMEILRKAGVCWRENPEETVARFFALVTAIDNAVLRRKKPPVPFVQITDPEGQVSRVSYVLARNNGHNGLLEAIVEAALCGNCNMPAVRRLAEQLPPLERTA